MGELFWAYKKVLLPTSHPISNENMNKCQVTCYLCQDRCHTCDQVPVKVRAGKQGWAERGKAEQQYDPSEEVSAGLLGVMELRYSKLGRKVGPLCLDVGYLWNKPNLE